MQELDMEISLKVIVVGNGCCGKSSLLQRFTKGSMPVTHRKTVGTEFLEKTIDLHDADEHVQLLLWDTAGQDMFGSVTRQYYQGAGGCVLVFATDDRDSFEAIQGWYQAVVSACGEDIVFVLVQNKIDLLSNSSAVTPEEVEELARRLNVKLYRTCVKDNINVKDVFTYLAEEHVRRGGHLSVEGNARNVASLESYSIAPDTMNDNAALSNSNQPTDAGNENHNQNGQTHNIPMNAVKQRNSLTAATPSTDVAVPSRTGSAQQPKRTIKHGSSLQPMTQRTGGKKKQDCSVM